MERGIKLIQAYHQTPWRRQLQLIGLFSATVIFIGVVAGAYLNVAARAANIGREIQSIQRQIRATDQNIEHLEAQYGILTSARVMRERAEALGYVPVQRDELMYLPVEGYTGRDPAQLAPPPQAPAPDVEPLPREFTISLIEWLQDMIFQVGLQTGAVVEGAAT